MHSETRQSKPRKRGKAARPTPPAVPEAPLAVVESQPDAQAPSAGSRSDLDPLNLAPAFAEATANLLRDPSHLLQTQADLWHDYIDLWRGTTHGLLGLNGKSVAVGAGEDPRFKDLAWTSNPFFALLKDNYLIAARHILNAAGKAGEGLDAKTAQKVEFFTRQFVDALSPSNFALTNPQVLRAIIESNGHNLLRGLTNLARDLGQSDGQLRVSMTDLSAFKIGVNLATTPGAVVYQNDMMQLLQYWPATDEVFERPLLIVPPWINKYYILDLQAKNSFIKWLVEQGHTVFVISWVNPGKALADKAFDDYLADGMLAALDAIEQATGAREVNTMGYCLGGTLLASALAYLAARKEPRVASATFLTTMIDFAEPGELGVFIDDQQIAALERQMEQAGYLDGKSMANTFNLLRANDLIWSSVINSYLLGNDPPAFDLLYWNADSTRLPARMHSFYLRNMYLENRFKDPGGIELCGVPIDVSKITTPAYFLSTEQDHIAPWRSTYSGARLLAGPVQFVLAESGHIAGVINPPTKEKYGYRTSTVRALPDPDGWLAGTQRHGGSWWPHWQRWIGQYAGARVAQRRPGDGKLKVIEPAPGSYVQVLAEAGEPAAPLSPAAGA